MPSSAATASNSAHHLADQGGLVLALLEAVRLGVEGALGVRLALGQERRADRVAVDHRLDRLGAEPVDAVLGVGDALDRLGDREALGDRHVAALGRRRPVLQGGDHLLHRGVALKVVVPAWIVPGSLSRVYTFQTVALLMTPPSSSPSPIWAVDVPARISTLTVSPARRAVDLLAPPAPARRPSPPRPAASRGVRGRPCAGGSGRRRCRRESSSSRYLVVVVVVAVARPRRGGAAVAPATAARLAHLGAAARRGHPLRPCSQAGPATRPGGVGTEARSATGSRPPARGSRTHTPATVASRPTMWPPPVASRIEPASRSSAARAVAPAAGERSRQSSPAAAAAAHQGPGSSGSRPPRSGSRGTRPPPSGSRPPGTGRRHRRHRRRRPAPGAWAGTRRSSGRPGPDGVGAAGAVAGRPGARR